VPVAKQVFDAAMPGKNQIDSGCAGRLVVTEAELTAAPEGPRTERALRHNLRVGVQYLEAWLRGSGCVPLYNLMEDAVAAPRGRRSSSCARST
jgi:malate synthase